MAELNYSKKRLEPLIAKFNIDVENDKVFHAIVTLFPNQTDYQMWALKAVYNKVITLDNLIYFKEWADENSTEISHLSKKNLVSYKTVTDFSALNREIENINAVILVKRVINCFNTAQRHLLVKHIIEPIIATPYAALSKTSFKTYYLLFKDFEKLPVHRKQKFISLMSAVKDLTIIKHHIETALQETYEWNREDMLSYAQRCCPDTEICFDKDNIVVLRIPSFQSSQKLCGNGRTSWCLTREQSYFNNYTAQNEDAQQYFLFDFNKKENHELAHVGFSVNPNRGITHAHSTRNNSLVGNGQKIDGKQWNIKSILDFHKINKNVYIRLKPLTQYKWDKESFLRTIANNHFVVNQIDDNRFIVPIENSKVFDTILSHTLVSKNIINNNTVNFAVVDFGKEQNDDASILTLVFAKDRYEVLSFNTMYDAYGVKNQDSKNLGKHHLTSDMFVKIGDINPNILLHKLIDEQNIDAAIKLLNENKDIDPNTIFYGSMPIIKAITNKNLKLFKALVNHKKFDLILTEGIGEPYLQFLMLYMETIIEDKQPIESFIEMTNELINNDRYDINALDLNGDSAIHIACEMHELSPIVEKLVANPKCDVNLKNEWGYTALDVALDNSPVNMKAVKALLSREDLVIEKDTYTFAKEHKIDLDTLRTKVQSSIKEKKSSSTEDDGFEEIFAKVFKA